MRKLHIEKGWYRSAGHRFKWTVSGHHIFGVGIDMRILRTEPEITVVVDGKEYLLDGREAMDFVRHYNADYTAGGTRLGVVSKSILKPLTGAVSAQIQPSTDQVEEEPSPQLPLF